MRGLDPGAYENFASFCRQDYPEFEILFAVNDPEDPVVPFIQKLMADFPERSIRLIVVTERLGANTKVSNLCRLVREARHDLLVITDSDVRVEPEYLRSVAAMFRDPSVGGVTALYRGRDNLELVAAMDCVGSSAAFCGAALVARELEGLKFMMGSTMATTKERLAEIGGFEAMVDLHSDDYELGRRIAARGYRIELLPEPVWMAFPSQTLGAYLRHELRWAIGIRNIRPGGHFGMLFTHGLPWAIAAACVAPSAGDWRRLSWRHILFCVSRWPGWSASGDCAIRCCGAAFGCCLCAICSRFSCGSPASGSTELNGAAVCSRLKRGA